MNDAPEPKKGKRRGLMYALIPGGFALLVLILLLSGFWRQEVTEEPPTVVEQPPEPLDE
jgi:TRAP-type C4-dicarboxylate transport system permease small subunit